MTDLIIRWGDVLPGDQALDEARLITVTEVNVRPQEGHPDFLIAYVGGYTEDGRGVSTSPPADWLTAVRRPAGAGEAPSTVTVATPHGADVLAASEWDRLNGGGLLASDNGNLVAEYAPGGWHGVVKDSARAPSGPGSAAGGDDPDRLVSAITVAAWHGDLSDAERVGRIRKLLGLPEEQAEAGK